MSESTNSPVPVVVINDGKLTTTSRNVAEVFGKQHNNVMRDITVVMSKCPESFRLLNFEQAFYEVQGPNGDVHKYPMYNLTKDGLVLLVMGYTSKRAMEFKIAYIEAFNAMEAKLKAVEQARVKPLAPIENPQKNTFEACVDDFLSKALHYLDAAYQHAEWLKIVKGQTPIEECSFSLAVACNSNINAAAAIVRAIIAAKKTRDALKALKIGA